MRILLYTPAFLPQIGGLEINVANQAEHLTRAGCEVVVVTTTAGPDSPENTTLPFRVVRRPGPAELLRWVRWCDIYFQANVSLRGLWPLLLVRRPWVVSHHSWYCRSDGRVAWQDRLKRRLLRHAAASIAVSHDMAADLEPSTLVIANPYRDNLFRVLPPSAGSPRDGDLVFVGRLVSDKGMDVLLDALALLAGEGLTLRLTVIGDGPEAEPLRNQSQRLGLAGRVDFLGTRTGEDLVAHLNRHRILVVPSRYAEPFGIVALEGIACGCVVVGSERGGLKEAIGRCGPTFRNGDAADLARVLGELLRHPEADAGYLLHAEEHLARHRSERVTAAYLAVLSNVMETRRGARGPAGRGGGRCAEGKRCPRA